MATPDTTQWASSQVGESGTSLSDLFALSDLFGFRDKRHNAWLLESDWLNTVLSSPRDEIVVRHDELSLRAVSGAHGQVVVAISDEQAGVILDQSRDAFPSQ